MEITILYHRNNRKSADFQRNHQRNVHDKQLNGHSWQENDYHTQHRRVSNYNHYGNNQVLLQSSIVEIFYECMSQYNRRHNQYQHHQQNNNRFRHTDQHY